MSQLAMPDNVCIGAVKHYYVDTNPIPGSTYTWRINGLVQAASTTNAIDITWNTTGIHTLDVQELSVTGCPGPLRTGQVFVSPLPAVTLVSSDADNTFYAGASITFTADGGTNYEFYVDAVSVQTGTANTYTSTTLANGQVVSVKATNATGCSATSAGITVNVITLPSGWTINPLTFNYNGDVTAKVFIDFTAVGSGFFAAFVGEECRGIAEPVYFSPANHYVFNLTCYSNLTSGEVLKFMYYDPAKSKTYELNKKINFTANMVIGDAISPIQMYNTVLFNKPLSVGWNWLSVNALLDNMTLGSVLSTVTANGDYIKNQVSTATYYTGFGWFGTLTVIDPARLYKIKVQNNTTIAHAGVPVNLNLASIGLNTGWNWIGYYPQNSLTISNALASVSLSNLDYIKNQTKTATYYTGFGWFGTLTNMSPADGYMIRVANPGTLKYPLPSVKKGQNKTPEETETSFNPAEYEYNGSVTAMVNVEGIMSGSDQDILYAYIKNEIRGVSKSHYFEPKGVNLFPLMVHSNISAGDTVEFMYYNALANKTYPCSETIKFTKDMIVADANKPFVLNISTNLATDIETEKYEELDLKSYPNPFDRLLNIEYKVPKKSHVQLSIYDSSGRLVKLLVNQEQIQGNYTLIWDGYLNSEGMYFIKLQAGSKQDIQKVTLIK
jgi:hypothetical protein